MEAIREHYHDNYLDSQAAAQVINAFGLDRTLYVLANAVQQKDWGARFSPGNREWAKTISIPKIRTLGAMTDTAGLL